MTDNVLTDQFQFVKFPRSKSPTKEEKREKQVKAWNEMKKRSVRRMVKNAPKMPVARRKKVKHHKLPSIKSLKARADAAFSLYIRKRDGKCVLCSSRENLTNGHLIKRGNMPTRYDELNCHCLCSTCNFKDWKHKTYHDVYVAWFICNFGGEAYISLTNKIHVEQWKRYQYEEIISKYAIHKT